MSIKRNFVDKSVFSVDNVRLNNVIIYIILAIYVDKAVFSVYNGHVRYTHLLNKMSFINNTFHVKQVIFSSFYVT